MVGHFVVKELFVGKVIAEDKDMIMRPLVSRSVFSSGKETDFDWSNMFTEPFEEQLNVTSRD